jgi:UDP-4-amino-4-deoxy-L-arabinose-oxoglutarate aminotransferase
MAVRPNVIHSRHVFTALIEGGRRDAVIDQLKKERIGCVVNYRAIHLMQYFRERYGLKPGMFPNAERIGDQTISLPFYPGMPEVFVDIVADELRRALARAA